ncbi:MAG: DNA methyltransferase [Candidatus Hodarchaeales archaeon]|jgi:DNA modification methylase
MKVNKNPHRSKDLELINHNIRVPKNYYFEEMVNEKIKDYIEKKDIPNINKKKDKYKKSPLLTSTTVKRSTKIFNMHSYWSKKPHKSISTFIEHYTKKGDIVFDPFCGSGGTLLSSILGERKAIGIDLSPAATFFSAVLCSPPNLSDFDLFFHKIIKELRKQYSWIYEVPYQNRKREIHFGISSMKIRCAECSFIESYFILKRKLNKKCSKCGNSIKSTFKKVGYSLNEWHLRAERGKHDIIDLTKNPELFDTFEEQINKRISEELKKHPAPSFVFPPKGRTQVLSVRGIHTISDLYTPRNLLALCLYRDLCLEVIDDRLRRTLLYLLTACCLKASRMMGFNSDGIGRIQKNGLIAQLIVKDINVFDFLEIAFKGIFEGFKEIVKRAPPLIEVMISTQSASSLFNINDNSIDYIFTDPPYGERVQFWESNQVWEAWLGFNTKWDKEEIIVNKIRGLNESHWESRIKKAMKECYRVLKPGHWITLTYNDPETFHLLQQVMYSIGFQSDQADNIVVMETTAKSEKQLKNEYNLTKDLVVNFRKPYLNETYPQQQYNEDDAILKLIKQALLERPGISLEEIMEYAISSLIRKKSAISIEIEDQIKNVAEERPEGSNQWYIKGKLFASH